MSRDLPEILDLAPFQGDSAALSGQLSTHRMSRLRDVGEVAGEVAVSLTLAAQPRGDMSLSGHVEATIGLTCQRCLDPVDIPLVGDFGFVVVDADQAGPSEAESADVVLAHDGKLHLGDLVEDELLLALPVVARHDDSNPCRPASQHFGPAGEPMPEPDNPFAVLEQLKRNRDD
jgi:uncharacterized protein